jgi:broad specificity phosphatase PhoE
MELYLLRHGQAHANVKKLVTGTAEDTLTRLGKLQAAQAGELLEALGVSFAGHYVSHWQRAVRTAAIALPAKKFTVDPRTGETYAGTVSDMPRADFEKANPDFFTMFNPDAAFPDGESHTNLFNRVTDWLKETSERHDEGSKIILSTHMGPISCILQYAFSIPMAQFPRFKPDNASLTVLDVPPGAAPESIELLHFNRLT